MSFLIFGAHRPQKFAIEPPDQFPADMIEHIVGDDPELIVKLALTSRQWLKDSPLVSLYHCFRGDITALGRYIASARVIGRSYQDIIMLSDVLSRDSKETNPGVKLRNIGIFTDDQLQACTPKMLSLLGRTDVLLHIFRTKGNPLAECLALSLDEIKNYTRTEFKSTIPTFIDLIKTFFSAVDGSGEGKARENELRAIMIELFNEYMVISKELKSIERRFRELGYPIDGPYEGYVGDEYACELGQVYLDKHHLSEKIGKIVCTLELFVYNRQLSEKSGVLAKDIFRPRQCTIV